MLNKTSNFVVTFLVTLLITAGLSFAQDKSSCCSNKEGKDKCKTKVVNASEMQDSTYSHINHEGHMHSSTNEQKSSIVREGTIDLAAIDENGDGKVYQDQMCWNVVSDGSGECPQCGMKLKEVSLEEAKANLEENGFKVM